MNKKIGFSIILLLFTSFLWSKTGILNRIISVDIKQVPIKTILYSIEQLAEVQFSYNPNLIQEDKIVSLSIQKKTIAYGLTLIFNKNVRFKEVGSHIVLLKNEDVDALKKRKKANLTIHFNGVITDKRTGNPIKNASIYDVDARHAAISSADGTYSLEIPFVETIRSLYFRKKGYKEFVMVVDVSSNTTIRKNVSLEPLPQTIEKIEQSEVSQIERPIENKVLSGALISYDTYVHTENLSEIEETRIAQISLVPSVSFGSNLSTNGLITNHFSLNLISGYSNGVAGLEIGSILNIVKGNAKWVQVGGVSNIVGGKFEGVQVGGIMNSVHESFNGVQVGGIMSNVGHGFIGIQTSGIMSITQKNFRGLQLSGISSAVVGHISGVQISGIFSAARLGVSGLQLSGIYSLADSNSRGMQVAGIINSSHGNLYGGQIAGVGNISRSGVNLVQIAGISNLADTNIGLQLGGVINFAKRNNGLQIALVNTSIESNGVSIGFFNFVKKGYHKTEISANGSFPLNIIFKSGTRRLYNTYNLGVRFDSIKMFAAGLGFGTNFTLKEKWQLSCDIATQFVFDSNFESTKYSQLFKFSTTLDYKISKWITVFIGPSININRFIFANTEDQYITKLGNNSFYTKLGDSGRTKTWVGGRIGIRL